MKTTSAEAAVRLCLERIDAREAEIGAWEVVDGEGALRQARICDHCASSGVQRGQLHGLLHGIPIGVKDIIDVAALPTRHGSPIYAHNIAASDAACVALAKAAGAIVLGKTVTTELAVFHPGKTRNPRNLAHTPGGSSSGSAAAVASGMVALAFGTQTAGSVIRPAAYCGIVGFKPSFGMISRAGVKTQAESLDTIGFMAGNVEDVALFAAGVSGDHNLLVGSSATPAPRIGVWRTDEWNEASAATHNAIETAAARFAECGAQIKQVNLPEPFAQLGAAQKSIQLFEAARSFTFEYEAHREQLSARLRALIEEGRAISWQSYRAALDLASRCRALIADEFRDIDVLLTPSAPGAAPLGLASTGDPVFNRCGTALHLPCITLPGAGGADELPIGIQLIGPLWQDAMTLHIAYWAQQTLR